LIFKMSDYETVNMEQNGERCRKTVLDAAIAAFECRDAAQRFRGGILGRSHLYRLFQPMENWKRFSRLTGYRAISAFAHSVIT
jgi:hypothetical protein